MRRTARTPRKTLSGREVQASRQDRSWPPGEDLSPVNDAPRQLRFTRRRLLILGGAAAAGFAATLAGVRAWSGSGAAPAGGPATSPSAGELGHLSRAQRRASPRRAARGLGTAGGRARRAAAHDRPRNVVRPAAAQRDQGLQLRHGLDGRRREVGGVTTKVLLDQAGVKPGARVRRLPCPGPCGRRVPGSLPLDLVTAPDTVLADTLDGAPLPPEHGGPLRLVVPRQLGYKNVKWVVRDRDHRQARARVLGAARLPRERAGSRRMTCRAGPSALSFPDGKTPVCRTTTSARDHHGRRRRAESRHRGGRRSG